MTPQERRHQGTSRVIAMRGDDGAFDRAAWRGTSMQQRLEALWDLTLDYLSWTAADDPEPRLDKFVCVVTRHKALSVRPSAFTAKFQASTEGD